MNTFKSGLYHRLSLLMPSLFKKRFFSKLHLAFEKPENTGLLPEKELLVLNFLVKEGWVAVDVGANNGLYSYFFKEYKKCKEVYAFEPLPNLYHKLEKWFGNIRLFNLALSDRKSVTKLHIPVIHDKLYESRAKLDDLKEENESHSMEIEIRTETLDAILAEQKPDRVDIIKIDIEGHELTAIKGAEQTIKTFKPFLIVEIEGRHHGHSVKEAVATICALNYEAYFFNFKNKTLNPFSGYDMASMQDAKNQNTFNYINNFLFFPLDKKQEVEIINKQLAGYFSKAIV
jgi:FkbM family methyltransferase